MPAVPIPWPPPLGPEMLGDMRVPEAAGKRRMHRVILLKVELQAGSVSDFIVGEGDVILEDGVLLSLND